MITHHLPRWLPAVVLLGLLLPGCGQAPSQPFAAGQLSRSEFADAFAARLREVDPDLSVSVDGEAQLLVQDKSGEQLHLFLNNAYQRYKSGSEALDDVVEHYTAGFLDRPSFTSANKTDITAVIPVVKDVAYARGVADSVAARGHARESIDLYSEPLNSSLVVLYAVDGERSISYLRRDDFEALVREHTDLRQRALNNLKARLPDVKVFGGGGRFAIIGDTGFEASLLLFGDTWTKEKFDVMGDIVVAIPSREMVLITGSADHDGVAATRELAAQRVAEAAYSLTDQLFVRRGGRWVLFEQ